jgi:hypothetical protein
LPLYQSWFLVELVQGLPLKFYFGVLFAVLDVILGESKGFLNCGL